MHSQPLDPLPVPTAPSEEERKICALQHGIAARLRASRYYIVEQAKSDGTLYLSLHDTG